MPQLGPELALGVCPKPFMPLVPAWPPFWCCAASGLCLL